MTTAVDVELDARTIEELRTVCEAEHGVLEPDGRVVEVVKCVRPAEWVAHTRCECGAREINLLCTPCLGYTARPDLYFRCEACGWRGRIASIRTEPLRPVTR